jgi:hypothetical protein
MKKETHICQGRNKRQGYVGLFLDVTYGTDRRKCNSKGVIFENDKWYCKRHAPSVIKLRKEKSEETDRLRIQRNLNRNEKRG